MTIDEFLARLAETKGGWRLKGVSLRTRDNQCPLTRLGGGSSCLRWGSAAERLGIDHADACRIVIAADGSRSNRATRELRARLLAACGCEEADAP